MSLRGACLWLSVWVWPACLVLLVRFGRSGCRLRLAVRSSVAPGCWFSYFFHFQKKWRRPRNRSPRTGTVPRTRTLPDTTSLFVTVTGTRCAGRRALLERCLPVLIPAILSFLRRRGVFSTKRSFWDEGSLGASWSLVDVLAIDGQSCSPQVLGSVRPEVCSPAVKYLDCRALSSRASSHF